jgi:hypothetical protein
MTHPPDELTRPFVERLRDDLVGNLPRYRRRRRRRLATATAAGAVAVVAVVGLVGGTAVRDRGSDDRTADVATGGPAPGAGAEDEEAAIVAVRDFVRDLRRGDVEAAARRWSGYPGGDDLASRVAGVEDLGDELPWLADPTFLVTSISTPIWPGRLQAVTVTSAAREGDPKQATAFLVDRGSSPAIRRLPSARPAVPTPAPGTTVTPGQEIVIPVEGAELLDGDVVVFFGGSAVSSSRDGDVLRVRVPATVRNQIVLTIMVPTPELPVTYAYWFPVG